MYYWWISEFISLQEERGQNQVWCGYITHNIYKKKQTWIPLKKSTRLVFWSVRERSLSSIGQTAHRSYKENKEMTVLELCVEPPHAPLPFPFWAWRFMFTWQLDIQIHPKSWKERKGNRAGQGAPCYSSASLCVFNWVIFISSFAARMHSYGLQGQVRQKLWEQS